MCLGIIVAGVPAAILSLFGNNVVLKILESITIIATYNSFNFGIPFWFIIRPRLLRRKHQQRVKAADAAIASLFNSL